MERSSKTYETRFQSREREIERLLGKCALSVKHASSSGWELIIANGRPVPATARVVEEWLLLDAPLDLVPARGNLWRLLRLNANLEGLAKLALPARAKTAHLRAEVPLDDGIDLSGRLHEVFAGMSQALMQLHGEEAGKQSKIPDEDKREYPVDDALNLSALLDEAGWPHSERTTGRLAAELETRGDYYQAIIEAKPKGGILISAELMRAESLSDQGRDALAALLLRASAIVRMASASAGESDDGYHAQFEIYFPSTPAVVELGHSLSALSVACALCGREARALEHEPIAREYLARQAWFS